MPFRTRETRKIIKPPASNENVEEKPVNMHSQNKNNGKAFTISSNEFECWKKVYLNVLHKIVQLCVYF